MSTVEHVLHDGGRLILQGHSLVRRSPTGRVIDLAWWPLWKVVDFLREQKVGGLDAGDEVLLREQMGSRRHPSFAVLEAPINWQDLCWGIGRSARSRWVVNVVPSEAPHAVIKVDGRERFQVAASTRGATQGCRVVLFDDHNEVTATLVREIALLMKDGGQLLRAPVPDGQLSVSTHNGEQLQACLLREPVQAEALLNTLGITSREVRAQFDIHWLTVHELRVLPQAEHWLIDF